VHSNGYSTKGKDSQRQPFYAAAPPEYISPKKSTTKGGKVKKQLGTFGNMLTSLFS
jgi:hypothetical protein